MNFKFNEEEQDILKTVCDFADKKVAPIAAEIDENERFPEETWHAMADMGLFGSFFPDE